MNKKWIPLILGLMCFILTLLLAVQYRTVENASKIAGTEDNSELKTEVLRWKGKYEEVYSVLQKAEDILEEKRKSATTNDNSSLKLQEELKKLNSLIGAVDVTGSGVVITVADNKNVTSENLGVFGNISDYLIHDKDLLTLVNELKNAGAEAISINDERIMNTTAITCDGNVVLINDNKISSPFVIKAIGSQEAILGGIQRPGGYLEKLEGYGLVTSVEKQDKITIYKYNGIINYKMLED